MKTQLWCIACEQGAHVQCLGNGCQCVHLVRVTVTDEGERVDASEACGKASPAAQDEALIQTFNGVAYFMRPVVCESHRWPGGDVTENVIVDTGMVSRTRGLVCPSCYGKARYATQAEAAHLRANTYAGITIKIPQQCLGLADARRQE